MKLKVHLLDFDVGSHEVFLNEVDAQRYGLVALDRIVLSANGAQGIPAVVKVAKTSVPAGFVGVAKDLLLKYGTHEGDELTILPASRPKSVDYIKKKLDGKTLKSEEIRAIIEDIAKGNLTDI